MVNPLVYYNTLVVIIHLIGGSYVMFNPDKVTFFFSILRNLKYASNGYCQRCYVEREIVR